MGNKKIGIVGGSTIAMLVLIVSSYYNDISLTIALTLSNFVMEGFYQANRDGRKGWPGENEFIVTYKGKPLPYLPFVHRHPDYRHKVMEESRKIGNKVTSIQFFIDSEKAHPIQEEEKVKVENIKGKLVFIGAEDDYLWETAKYIRRMEDRLKEKEYLSIIESYIYEHVIHFIYPKGCLK